MILTMRFDSMRHGALEEIKNKKNHNKYCAYHLKQNKLIMLSQILDFRWNDCKWEGLLREEGGGKKAAKSCVYRVK